MNRVCSSVQKCVLPLGLFVCFFLSFFLPGRCVYKLHYSKVKDKRREKRMHIHTYTRANNGLQPKRIALLPVASNCFSTSSLSISKSVCIFMRASPVSLFVDRYKPSGRNECLARNLPNFPGLDKVHCVTHLAVSSSVFASSTLGISCLYSDFIVSPS